MQQKMRATFLFLVIIASLFQNSTSSIGRSKQKVSPTKKQESATPTIERTQVEPTPAGQDNPHKQESNPKPGPQQRPEKPPWWDVAWSTWALVVVGVIAAYIALRTLADIEEQTNATKIAANAAQKTAEIAEQTLRLTQAADVQIVGVNFTPKGTLNTNTSVTVALRNFGQSRAKQFTNDLTIGIEGRKSAPVQPRQEIGVVLGPGQPFIIGFPPLGIGKIVTEEELERILNGQQFLKIWGSLKYKDVFGQQRVILCEGTYDRVGGNFMIDRYESADEDGEISS
jgi:hypothetical protein